MAAVPPQNLPAEFLAEDRRPQTIVGMAVPTGIAGIVVLTRVYARWRHIQKFGLDDALICAAMAVNIVLLAVMIMVLRHGAGRHLAALNPANAPLLYKWLVAGQLIYMFNLYICRLSGLAFYARLNSMPRYVFYLRLSFAFITAVYVAQTLIIALQCIPLSTLWTRDPRGKCISTMVVNIVTATMTIICDSIILLLPINIIWTVRAKLARKIALAIVLCFGVFAVVTSVCRLLAMLPVVNKPNDATWYFSVVLAWSSAEISAAIIALSLPALKALFGSALKDKSSSNDSNSNSNSNGGSRSQGANNSDVPLNRVTNKTGRVYGDVKGYSHSVRGGRSASEEVLWATSTDDESIQVQRTVRVTYKRDKS
ncbi:hypothetical protein BJY01DRAFT_247311 [Aspergillus pseudoustus]|uniref:Rhodopsin domain-containing protein n=1 Tax=Aspergillus pseudoustus TaxID=1810923 RepID=A0ABR4K254_9EURO